MRMQEYVDLIKEITEKQGVEWDNTTATLAVYQYLNSPAISNYYNNLKMKRSYDGHPVICEMSYHGAVMSMGFFKYDGARVKPDTHVEKISYNIETYGPKPRSEDMFITNKVKEQMQLIRERFLNANSFAEFSEGFKISDFNNYEELEDKFDFKIRKLLHFASTYNEYKNDESDYTKRILVENVLSIIDDTYKFANHRHQNLIVPIVNMITKEKTFTDEEMFNQLYIIGAYDEVMSDNYYFDIRPVNEKIEHYHQLAKMPEIKDNTVLGVVMNNPDDIINKLADTFMFDELKTLALIQTRLAIKATTLEEMIEARPIISDIYQEAVRRSPMLETDIDARFEHIRINDKYYDLKGEKSISFSHLMDSVGLYPEHNSDYYLTIQPEIIVFPRGTSEISNEQGTERFIGHDGVGPYYVLFAYEAPLTLEVNSLVFDEFNISKHLDNKHVKQLFVNMFDECMVRQLPLVIEDSNFYNLIGEDRLKIFEEVLEQYKGIVPTIISPIGLNKYRALLESELTYSQIVAMEPKLDELATNRSNLQTFRTFIEEQSKGLPEIKKTIPKL